ncbi:MAG: tetratricopeptide repeat protein [Hyphomicrobium sp.]
MDTTAIKTCLDRALASPSFRRAGRLRRFLEFVVRAELAGRGERLKEYAVGLEVFDRGEDFDPRIDNIVRVEAIRLRARLDDYFRTDGATEPVRISMPKGSYRPTFSTNGHRPEPILDDPESLYWLARSLIFRFSPDDYRRAIRLLGESIRRWPDNARLNALMAECAAGATCSDIGFLAPEDGLPLMQQAAGRALALDPENGPAHFFVSLASLRLADKSTVRAAIRRALELCPTESKLQHWAAVVLLADGRTEEALLHIHKAERLQPDALLHRTFKATLLLAAGQTDAATGNFRDILEFDPANYAANLWLSRGLCACGRFEDARATAGRAFAVSGSAQALAALAYAEACAGNSATADRLTGKLIESERTQYVRPTSLAAIDIARGRLDEAKTRMEVAVQQGDFHLSWSRVDRRWEPLRGRVAGL